MISTRALVLLLGLSPFIPLRSQALNPPYLSELPPVARVLADMKVADPDMTAARQMGTFLQLKKFIEDMADVRRYRGQLTKDEIRLLGDYQTAYMNIAKTKPEYGKFMALKGLDIDPRWTDTLFAKYFSAGFKAKYEQVNADYARQVAARAKADTQSMMNARAQDAQAQQQVQQRAQQSAASGQEQRQVRRCVESGRSQSQCMANGLGKSFADLIGGNPLGLLIPSAPATGLRMGGVYPAASKANVGLTFYPGYALVTCQDLVADERPYAVAVRNGQAVISIDAKPNPLLFAALPDGRLQGQGPVDIGGRIVTGVEHGVRRWSDGHTEPISRNIYGAATRRCTAGVLATSGPAPTTETVASAGTTALNLLMGGGDKQASVTVQPGLRLDGEYGSQAAFDLEFVPEGVVVGCRDAAILRQYKVGVVGGQTVVQVQHGASLLSFAVGADGSLTGAGSVRVDGRQVTQVNNDGSMSFTPRSATCNVGAMPAVDASAGAKSAPRAAGNAVLAVAVAPAAPVRVLLLDQDPAAVLSESGFKAAAGQSLLGTFNKCVTTDTNCQKAMAAIGGHMVVAGAADAQGKLTLAPQVAGAYFVFAGGGSTAKPLMWSVPVQLKAGDNTLMLDERNATKQ